MKSTTDSNSEDFYRQDFSAEQALLATLRTALLDPQQKTTIPSGLKFQFDPGIANIYLTLFQEGLRPLRWGSRKKTLAATLERIVQKLRTHKRFKDFSVSDPARCRIMLEIVTEQYPCDPRRLTTIRLDGHRLEPGIHGLRFNYGGQTYYFMPTDAVTHSLMTVKQVFNYLAKQTGLAKRTNSITERTELMRSLITDCMLIRSFAVISSGDRTLPLYRGYPLPVELSREFIRKSTVSSTDWILANMKPNGQFLYYYDPVTDSEVDFQHPRMTAPTYYNILRHAGGTITLLRAFELTGDAGYIEAAGKSIDFFITVTREHEYEGRYACYPFFNRKSKLGGAGIGLAAMVHYFRLSGDGRYRKYIDGLVCHILSRVSDTGELIGYFIHPSFFDGREIIDPDEETRKQLFSFYYPGEALLGLVLYLKHVPDIEPELRDLVLKKAKKALDFLIYERPVTYRHLFQPLPADGWLMQAIEEWVGIEGFADRSYLDFVHNDAQAMIDHMYQEDNAPFFDYTGAFYYQFGEHAYPDGARCEGLIAAYNLARSQRDNGLADYYLPHIIRAAKSLAYTYNTPESCYGHKRPAKSINSFRFKLTRQWVRVDSVQHTACFYARLLPVLTDEAISAALKKKQETGAEIDGFRVLEKIEKGGFATVYLVADPADSSKLYALKQLHRSRYNFNRIVREAGALKIINTYPHTIRCRRGKLHDGEFYFLFDYAGEGDLRNHIRRKGPLDQQELFRLLQDILDEILFARENNLLHLDISIFNIILFNNRFSLIDWGLSNSGPAARTTAIKGHRTYLAPEIYNGRRTFASEIYSLGATLFYAATGKVIFDIHTQNTPFEQKMFKHLYCRPDFPPTVPEKTKYLLLRMLDKYPDTRATVDEIRVIMRDDFTVPEYTCIYGREAETFDLSDTLVLYRKMAQDGICHAQWQLGRFCEKGEHVEQSYNLAGHWYQRAADKGYAPALCGLAMLCRDGKGVEQDLSKAFSLFEMAAEQGHGEAQFHLARMVENGRGTAADPARARTWYLESARNSYGKAVARLEELGIDLLRDAAGSIQFEYPGDVPATKLPLPEKKVVPLGDDCQLGAALEVYGYQETSLFKWAKISPGQLADALENELREIYDTNYADFYIRPPNGRVGIVGDNRDIPLPRNGGWASYQEYMTILDQFDPAQDFHTAVIDRERGFTHGVLVTRSDLEEMSKEDIRKRNQEKITYLKNKTLKLIREADGELIFLRAQRTLTRELVRDLNRTFLALKKLRGSQKSFTFIVASPDPALHTLRDHFDLDIRVIFFDIFSPPDNPMLLRHSYPEWKKLFAELDIPVQGKFKKSILFSGFDTFHSPQEQ